MTTTVQTLPKLFTERETAAALGFSIKHLRQAFKQGKIRAYQPSERKRYYLEEHIAEFRQAKTIGRSVDP